MQWGGGLLIIMWYNESGTNSPEISERTEGGVFDITTSKGFMEGVSHFKQSTIRIKGEKTVYIDPFSVDGEPKDADIVFVTHTHRDHFSIADIKKVMKVGAILVITADGVESAKKEGLVNITEVMPNKEYTVDGVSFRTVPAYNTNKDFHKKSCNWVGYIINRDNTLYYHAGDTDIIPEMKDLDADVVFLPVGGTYTMDAGEAIDAANLIKPVTAVPIHFADVVGTVEDAQKFVNGLDDGIKGVILKK